MNQLVYEILENKNLTDKEKATIIIDTCINRWDRIRIDINILRTVPPCNMNSDEHGNVKSSPFGCRMRLMTSSQSINCTDRKELTVMTDDDNISVRTRFIGQYVAKVLREMGYDEDVCKKMEIITPALSEQPKFLGKDQPISSQIIQYSRDEVIAIIKSCIPLMEDKEVLNEIANRVIKSLEKKKEEGNGKGKKEETEEEKEARNYKGMLDLKEIENQVKKEKLSLDIALHGRMGVSGLVPKVHSAIAQSYSLGVTVLDAQTDYYSATDDMAEEVGNSGAALLDNKVYASDCMFEHTEICIDIFLENCFKGFENASPQEIIQRYNDAMKYLVEKVGVRMHNVPTGKKTAFAHVTYPAISIISIAKKGINLNPVGAFQKAISSDEEDIEEVATRKLVSHLNNMGTRGERARKEMKEFVIPGPNIKDAIKDSGESKYIPLGAKKIDYEDDLFDELEKIFYIK